MKKKLQFLRKILPGELYNLPAHVLPEKLEDTLADYKLLRWSGNEGRQKLHNPLSESNRIRGDRLWEHVGSRFNECQTRHRT